MSNPMKSPLFLDDFPPVTTKAWEKKIERDLGGPDAIEKLRWHTGESVNPLPFYRREDLEKPGHSSPLTDGNRTRWEIRSAVAGSTVREANRSARKALEGGADAVLIALHPAAGAFHGPGVPLQTQSDFKRLFKGIPLDQTPVHFDAGPLSPALLGLYWKETASPVNSGERPEASFLFDPFADQLIRGAHHSKPGISRQIHQCVSFCRDRLPGVRPLAIDARLYHNSGGTMVQELGFALGVASEYLAMLAGGDCPVDEAAGMLHFNVAAGPGYFLEIAKFRALRLLWKNLFHAYGGNPAQSPAYIHAETSRRNKAGYAPYTNMLRTTTEGMAAALGGCSALTVRPFDEPFREPGRFSRRMARNSQIIMREESLLHKVRDPAAGSYYIEQLTNDIARKSWQFFQKVEAHGGMAGAIANGFVQSSIKSSREQRDQAVATRERILVGVNQYPNPDNERAGELDQTARRPARGVPGVDEKEKGKEKEKKNGKGKGKGKGKRGKSPSIEKMAALLNRGATLNDIAPLFLPDPGKKIEMLHPYRAAGAFERLRLATEKHPTTPRVLNLPIGNRKKRRARASFSNNFFGCLGYEIKDPVGFEHVREAVGAVNREQPDIAVLCSSDKEYRKLVPAFCRQLGGQKTDPPRPGPLLVLAGYPEGDAGFYRKEGIDFFIHPGGNVLEALKNFQLKLGVMKNA